MVLIDGRINALYGIQLNTNNKVSKTALEYWVSPFFSVRDTADLDFFLLAKINVSDKHSEKIVFENGEFFIPSSMSEEKILYEIMFLSRAIFKCFANMLGFKNIHAGCLEIDGKGVLISASRNQGKTTVILHSLFQKEYSLVANDQLMFNSKNNLALGYPAAIGIRKGSCSDELYSRIKHCALLETSDPFQQEQKPIIHINRLKDIFQCNLKDHTKISMLVNYEKSPIQHELILSQPQEYQGNFSELSLPIYTAYSQSLFDSCVESINNYCSQCMQTSDINTNPVFFINVKCGISRIEDMLLILKQMIN